jgi:hypothetical protein
MMLSYCVSIARGEHIIKCADHTKNIGKGGS